MLTYGQKNGNERFLEDYKLATGQMPEGRRCLTLATFSFSYFAYQLHFEISNPIIATLFHFGNFADKVILELIFVFLSDYLTGSSLL